MGRFQEDCAYNLIKVKVKNVPIDVDKQPNLISTCFQHLSAGSTLTHQSEWACNLELLPSQWTVSKNNYCGNPLLKTSPDFALLDTIQGCPPSLHWNCNSLFLKCYFLLTFVSVFFFLFCFFINSICSEEYIFWLGIAFLNNGHLSHWD